MSGCTIFQGSKEGRDLRSLQASHRGSRELWQEPRGNRAHRTGAASVTYSPIPYLKRGEHADFVVGLWIPKNEGV